MNTVIIAGAGIIGLSTALELAQHGLGVTVLERGEPMREASWAAAGMLAAGDPENPAALRPLADLSLRLYRDYVSRVEELSGIRVPFRTTKTLQASHGDDFTLDGRSLFTLDELSLDPRDLCRALPLACQAAGVTLHAHTTVTEVSPAHREELAASGVEVRSGGGVWTATDFVDCRGAWASTPSLVSDELYVTPRKGQMLAVTLAPGTALMHTLRTPTIYIVPRGDGRVIVGATVENAGFNTSVEGDAIQRLFERACELWPPLAAGRITDTWAGLRPGTPDGLPVVDEVSPHRFVATGHFRNGILLAPATARVMRNLICRGEPEIDLAPYRARRFCVQSQDSDPRIDPHTNNDKQLTAAL